MDTFKSELIEVVTEGLIRLGKVDGWTRANRQAIDIVQGLFNRIENAERKAAQEESLFAVQQAKLERIKTIVTQHFYVMERQGRGSTHEWLEIDKALRGTK